MVTVIKYVSLVIVSTISTYGIVVDFYGSEKRWIFLKGKMCKTVVLILAVFSIPLSIFLSVFEDKEADELQRKLVAELSDSKRAIVEADAKVDAVNQKLDKSKKDKKTFPSTKHELIHQFFVRLFDPSFRGDGFPRLVIF